MASVKVAVRVRPLNERERRAGSSCVVSMEGRQTRLVMPRKGDQQHRAGMKAGAVGSKTEEVKKFTYDYSFWSANSSDHHFVAQQQVFDALGTPVLEAAFEGYNACLFAYGQTSAGKSFSMMGEDEHPGLIPRISKALFERVNENSGQEISFNAIVSYLEIYNEKVRDLLVKNSTSTVKSWATQKENAQASLKVREHPKDGPYVEGLSLHSVTTMEEIMGLIEQGNENRTVAATMMNGLSSRSHSIFTIKFSQATLREGIPSEITSKINLVDLAGSERVQTSGATGDRLKEGANINKSLTTLGLVISNLATNSSVDSEFDSSKPTKKKAFVPYRDSVLTWLLKDSLGGNAKTIMLAAISPADINHGETLSTLRYAHRAKSIINRPTINEDANVKLIRELRAEVALLRDQLLQIGGQGMLSGNDLLQSKLEKTEAMVASLTQNWESKWERTHKIIQERSLALTDAGASLHVESERPYLISVAVDRISTGVTICHLKEGETILGSADGDPQPEVILRGANILSRHCSIVMLENSANLVPAANAACVVDGKIVTSPTALRHGSLIRLGARNLFRYNDPAEAARLQESMSGDDETDMAEMLMMFDSVSPRRSHTDPQAVAAAEQQARDAEAAAALKVKQAEMAAAAKLERLRAEYERQLEMERSQLKSQFAAEQLRFADERDRARRAEEQRKAELQKRQSEIEERQTEIQKLQMQMSLLSADATRARESMAEQLQKQIAERSDLEEQHKVQLAKDELRLKEVEEEFLLRDRLQKEAAMEQVKSAEETALNRVAAAKAAAEQVQKAAQEQLEQLRKEFQLKLSAERDRLQTEFDIQRAQLAAERDRARQDEEERRLELERRQAELAQRQADTERLQEQIAQLSDNATKAREELTSKLQAQLSEQSVLKQQYEEQQGRYTVEKEKLLRAEEQFKERERLQQQEAVNKVAAAEKAAADQVKVAEEAAAAARSQAQSELAHIRAEYEKKLEDERKLLEERFMVEQQRLAEEQERTRLEEEQQRVALQEREEEIDRLRQQLLEMSEESVRARREMSEKLEAQRAALEEHFQTKQEELEEEKKIMADNEAETRRSFLEKQQNMGEMRERLETLSSMVKQKGKPDRALSSASTLKQQDKLSEKAASELTNDEKMAAEGERLRQLMMQQGLQEKPDTDAAVRDLLDFVGEPAEQQRPASNLHETSDVPSMRTSRSESLISLSKEPTNLRSYLINDCQHDLDCTRLVEITADNVCRGFLTKQGAVVRNWKKRFFVFNPQRRTLCYYTDHVMRECKGTIYFDAFLRVYGSEQGDVMAQSRPEQGPPGTQWLLYIQTNERLYMAKAPSGQAYSIWLDVLKTAVWRKP